MCLHSMSLCLLGCGVALVCLRVNILLGFCISWCVCVYCVCAWPSVFVGWYVLGGV